MEGMYELYPNGLERVTPYWGPLTLAIDPRKAHCPQDILVRESGISYQYCWEGKVGGAIGSRQDLSSKGEHILQRGRELAEQHWGLRIPRL